MKVLGIADNHASGVALVQDGKLTHAINQERIDRIKNSGAFPAEAIQEVLKIAGLSPPDIDLVAVASEITPTFGLRLLKKWHLAVRAIAGQFSVLYNLYVIYQVLSRFVFKPIYWADRFISKRIIQTRLQAMGFGCDIKMIEHHEAHAYSVFLTSPFEKATVITADAMGDGISVTVGTGDESGKIRRIFQQSGFAAINPYYSRVTEYLGFTPDRHEGKITGLAAYGDPKPLLTVFKRHMHFIGPGFSRLNFFIKQSKNWGFYRQLKGHSREDIAAALQRNLEIEVTNFVRHWIQKTGINDLCLAGGIFENVKLNQRIHEIDQVERIYIFPNMSDGGLSVGSALKEAQASPTPLETAYLGSDFDDLQITKALDKAKLHYSKEKNIAKTVAMLLAKGEIVTRFDGKMEFGPRALGHRSVLVQATDPKVNDWLNQKLKRTEFMPFAPAVCDQDAADCFIGIQGAEFTSRFMNICFDCTDELKQTCPGVVHIDGTARPQIVSRNDDAVYHEIIRQYREETGLKAIINTSYNMHEEPIVRTPEDAVRAFQEGGFKYLAMGSFLITRDES